MTINGALFIILSGMFVSNYVLQQFLGICSFLGVSKKLDQATGMSMAVIFVMVLSTAVTYPIQYYILNPNGLGYMQTIVFILVIAALVQLVEIVLKRYMHPLYVALGVYLPLITTNCAVLAVCISNVDSYMIPGASFGVGLINSVLNALGSGLGYFIAMVLFSGVRSRVEESTPPECFKGLPITLVAASILSVSFFGFTGVIENIFG